MAAKAAARLVSGGESRPRISPDISAGLAELDPLLNAKWQASVSAAFKTLTGEEREYAYHRYLAPKGIRVDAENRRLTFAGRPSLADVKSKLDSQKLIALAVKLEAVLLSLRGLSDAAPFVDLLEGSVSTVDDFAVGEELRQIRQKQMLRQAYLDELVVLVRSASLRVPATHRGLTAGTLREFLIEVFLRQKMLGYRFRTRSAVELKSHSSDFISSEIAAEAMTRQCELVATERYLFLIGPVKNLSLNPYSARRFLHEEVAMAGSAVFFSGMVIPLGSLEKPHICKHLSWTVGRVLTVERQVSAGVVSTVESAWRVREEVLLPILNEGVSADGSDLGEAIANKLSAFEQLLATSVLSRLPRALVEFAKTSDDYDYLFFNLRDYFLRLAADVREFSAQFALAYSDAVEELELRLLSYVSLLEKRRDTIFSLALRHSPEVIEDAALPLLEFRAAVKEFEPQLRKLKERQKQLQRAVVAPAAGMAGVVERVLNLTEKRRTALVRLEQDLALMKKQCLVGLIRICKRYPELTVYLELEGLVGVDEALRRYALPAGRDGISGLPRLVSLWEDQSGFDLAPIAERLGMRLLV